MYNLIKIRGDFLGGHEAEAAVEKISPHCYSVRVLYNGGAACDNNAAGYSDYFDGFEPGFCDHNMIMSGINTGWGLSPYGSYNFQHTRSYNYLSSLGLGRGAGKTTLEAEVSQDKYELVKERLYALGAVGVN